MKLIINDVWTQITEATAFGLALIDDVTSFDRQDKYFIKAYKKGLWDGRQRYRVRRGNKMLLPTGFIDRVTRYLDEKKYLYKLEDNRAFDSVAEPVYELNGAKLNQGRYDYQAEALDDALMYGRGIVKLPTGGGKTAVGTALLASYNLPSIWLTHRKVLLKQTKAAMEKYLQRKIGIVGDGVFEPDQITVCMVQTLQKRFRSKEVKELLENAQVLIGDEVHHLESDQWYGVFSACKAPHRFGLTATPNLHGPGMALVGQTGEIIHNLDPKDLIERGVLVEPRIYFLTVPYGTVDPNANWQKQYKSGIVLNQHRNNIITDIAVGYENKSRILILVHRIAHGKLLTQLLAEKGVKSEFIQGKMSQEDREATVSRLVERKLPVIVAMASIMGEGVDIPALDVVINATGTRGGGSSSNTKLHEVGRTTIQILGRGLRSAPDKTCFDYVDFDDQFDPKLAEAARERQKALQDEGYSDYFQQWNTRG